MGLFLAYRYRLFPPDVTREAFVRMSPVLRSMGLTLDESIDAVDTFSGLLVVSAASADRAQVAMNALSRSLQKGRVDADAWEMIYIAMPQILEILADSTGKAGEELLALGASGKMALSDLTQALVSGNAKILGLDEEMPTTVRDAFQKVGNEFTEFIGRANEASGVTAGLADAVVFYGENLSGILNVALVAGGAPLTGRCSWARRLLRPSR